MRDRSARSVGPLFRLDPGWLFLIAGLALLSATVMIPAADDLAEARWHRDRAIAVERWRAQRLANHSDYADALNRRDPSLVLSLAATQLNLAPAGRSVMVDASSPGRMPSASVFPGLEPRFVPASRPDRPGSLLQRLATGAQTRLWLFIAGAMLVLIGLLPPSEPARGV
ncbi:MAG TPA: hypothetical protein DEB06_06755 [Phycisphaerales bacterium]|nr:hypothetical protein [Phycisphaerales bacterium]